MPSTLTQSPLAANLASLGDRNADVVGLVRDVAPAPITFTTARSGALTAADANGPLASRHDPGEEGERLAERIDLLTHATTVVLGFGLGYHVKALARRYDGNGLIIVYEPDISLLRAVFERVDHSDWLSRGLVLFMTDKDDRAALARKLTGAESIVAQGVAFLEHPASRRRLGPASTEVSQRVVEHVRAAKTTFVTTLVRATDTIRNLLRNADHYTGGSGITDLAGIAAGRPAIVVSAGPSLHKNIAQLADPSVRERCVIIAVQTTLKTLLAAGVKPHFVTALDYHEISRRFYDGLRAEDVEDIELVVDPKAHPSILDAFPGVVRCASSPFLDKILGDLAHPMGDLPGGATVAHLAVYLARHLGCNPITLVGQDLGFTDGLYYAPGTAIHDVWACELNPFNTIAMMEWQRIARHRVHLHETVDIEDKPIFTDTQMLTYLQQFERDFAAFVEEGIDLIDATEGGVRKQHTRVMPLAKMLEAHAPADPMPPLPRGRRHLDPARLTAAESTFAAIEAEVRTIGTIARDTEPLLMKMLDDQDDAGRMARHFRRVEAKREEIMSRMDTFELINQLNQLGVFKRLKADRRLQLAPADDPVAQQRAQLERDVENVRWIGDASDELAEQLGDARAALRGDVVPTRPRNAARAVNDEEPAAISTSVAALIAIDPTRGGLGHVRRLDARVAGRTMLARTLERLGRVDAISVIILFVPDDLDITGWYDEARIGRPVEVERCGAPPLAAERSAVNAARRWAGPCWRGGLGGMTVFDEVFAPDVMHAALVRRNLGAGVLVGPDWPLVDVTDETGVPTLITRFHEEPAHHRLIFTQAPPGMGACLITEAFLGDFVERHRWATLGAHLGYQPHAPRADSVASDANVQIDHRLRAAGLRLVADDPAEANRLESIIVQDDATVLTPVEIVTRAAAIESASLREIVLELTTRRAADGLFRRSLGPDVTRADLTLDLLETILSDLDPDVAVTLAGLGDPLLHPEFETIVGRLRQHGISAIAVRTELRGASSNVERLLATAPDVISLDLHADRAMTYQAMMGRDDFADVLRALERLLNGRRVLAGADARTGVTLPWVVPHLQRRRETYADINSFYDRWQHIAGAVVIESPPPTADPTRADTLTEAFDPPSVVRRALAHRMLILSDGTAPVSELDVTGQEAAGVVGPQSTTDVWRRLVAGRHDRRVRHDASPQSMWTLRP